MPFIAPFIAAIGAAATAFGTFIAGLGVLGQVLIATGLNVAMGYLQKKRAGKQNRQDGGTKIDKQYGNDVSRQVAFGIVGAAGHDLYINTYGKSNKIAQQIFVLSDYYTSGLVDVWVNGEIVQLGTEITDRGRKVITGEYADYIWVKYYDGRQTAADATLINGANPSTRWSAQHIGLGTSYVIVTMQYDQEKMNSEPQMFFTFKGAPLYDWRKDTTAGGDGPQRWNDTTTHVFSENPIVQEYNYRRGLSINGDLFCGMAQPASDLPLDKFTIAANICDELVNGEARYKCSTFIDLMDTHGNNIDTMQTSCGAMGIESVGTSWPLVGSNQPVVMTFTDDDLIDGQPVRYRAKRSMSELVNSVSGTYSSPAQQWASIGYAEQSLPSAIVLDRRTRDVNIDFPQVYSVRQAEQLASIYLKENRFEATATITLRPRFCVLETGDWVRWNSERYGSKVYIITGTTIAPLESEDGPRNIMLSLQERDGSIYDGITPSVPVVPFPPGAPDYLNEIDPILAPVTVEGDTGVQQAAIRAVWDVIEDETVMGVEFRYWPVAQPDAVFYKSAGENRSTQTTFTEGVVGETLYAVQSRLITDPVRTTVWSAVKTVTTDAVQSDDYGPIIDKIQGVLAWVGSSNRAAIEAAAELIDYTTELSAQQQRNTQTLRRELISVTGTASARFSEEIQVLTDDNLALAARTDTLSAALGGNTAQINIKWAAAAAPGSYAARWALQAAVDADGLFRQATMFLDVPAAVGDPTRIGLIADQIVFTNYVNETARPFFIQDGVLYADQVNLTYANIGNLTVGVSNIDPGAVSEVEYWEQTGSGSFTTELVFQHETAKDPSKPLVIKIDWNWRYSVGGSTTASGTMLIQDVTSGTPFTIFNGVVLATGPQSPNGSSSSTGPNFVLRTVPPTQTNTVIRFTTNQGGATFSNCKILGMLLKV